MEDDPFSPSSVVRGILPVSSAHPNLSLELEPERIRCVGRLNCQGDAVNFYRAESSVRVLTALCLPCSKKLSSIIRSGVADDKIRQITRDEYVVGMVLES